MKRDIPVFTSYIGTPYTKCNCWDLVVEFYGKEYKLNLRHLFTGKAPDHLAHRQNLISSHKGEFIEVENPMIGDLIIMKIGGFESHIGIYAGHNKVLHSLEGTGVILDRLDRYKRLIVGFYRHRMLEE